MSSSAVSHLLAALLEHQRNNALHSDIELLVGPAKTTCTIQKLNTPPLTLDIPSSVGRALADFLMRSMHKNARVKESWREDIVEITIGPATYTTWVRMLPTKDGERITISSLDPDLAKSENLFTPAQRATVVDALDNRAGLIGVSGPTLGSTATVLYALQDVVKEYAAPHHIQLQPMLGKDALDNVRETLHRLPAFVFITLPEEDPALPEIWRALTQAAIAGSVIAVGLPGRTTHGLVSELFARTPSFLWEPLFQLSVVHMPFQSACPACAIPMPLHPDVLEQFAEVAEPSALRTLKSAHAPGCEECNFHGRGPRISTVELCTPDNLPDDILAPQFDNTVRARGMETIIDDLVSRSFITPVPLTQAAELWRNRAH